MMDWLNRLAIVGMTVLLAYIGAPFIIIMAVHALWYARIIWAKDKNTHEAELYQGTIDHLKYLISNQFDRIADLEAENRRLKSQSRGKAYSDNGGAHNRQAGMFTESVKWAFLALGIEPGQVSKDQVKAAYRKRAKIHHPDMGGTKN